MVGRTLVGCSREGPKLPAVYSNYKSKLHGDSWDSNPSGRRAVLDFVEFSSFYDYSTSLLRLIELI